MGSIASKRGSIIRNIKVPRITHGTGVRTRQHNLLLRNSTSKKPTSSSYCKRSIDIVDRTPSIPRKAMQSAFEEWYFQNHLLPVLTSNEA
jgi:hypothetical protein